jgi:MscS family membrane protein
VSVAQWVVWAGSIVLPLAALGLLAPLALRLARWIFRGAARQAFVDRWYPGLHRPLAVALALGVHAACVPLFAFTLPTRVFYSQLTAVASVIVLGWLVWRLLTLVFGQARAIALGRRQASTQSLMLLGERVAKAFLLLAGLFALLRIGGVDTTTALAGVGIGGVDVALGAQRSVENLLGGVFLLTDKALAVGDVCCIADRMGCVEDITLRSVRLRTLEQTLLSIPAGVLAQATIENLTTRQKILLKTTLRLGYPTPPDQLRTILARIHRAVVEHPEIEAETARVRLVEFRETAIELELFAYVLTADYPRFLGIREDVLLEAAAIVEAAGGAFAALPFLNAAQRTAV